VTDSSTFCLSVTAYRKKNHVKNPNILKPHLSWPWFYSFFNSYLHRCVMVRHSA